MLRPLAPLAPREARADWRILPRLGLWELPLRSSAQSKISSMKGSKDTLQRSRNNKQMWKRPGTAHIAAVRCGLGVLNEIKDRLGNEQALGYTIRSAQPGLKRNQTGVVEIEKKNY